MAYYTNILERYTLKYTLKEGFYSAYNRKQIKLQGAP